MNANRHLLLWSSLGALALLIVAAVQENFLRDWRRIQSRVRLDGQPVDVRLRQVVVPRFGVTDRCVSCHLGMVLPGRTSSGDRLAGAHPPVVHDPAEFGCTVCHGGQGRATEAADAHGDVPHWPQPMIPLGSAYAGCGTCHIHPRVPQLRRLEEARNVVERSDCLSCHRIDGRGGTVRPGGRGGMEGPDLSRVGLRGYDRAWYEKHLQRARSADDVVWRGAIPPLGSADLEAIGLFLDSRVGAPRLMEAKALFHSLGCRGCHKVNGAGGDDGPDLTMIGARDPGQLDFTHVPGKRTLAAWLSAHTRDPARVVPGSRMPKQMLSEAQIDLLTCYLLSLRGRDFPGDQWPRDRTLVRAIGHREVGGDGGDLFAAFCSACHGDRGQGMRFPGSPPFPAIGNPDFLAVATDAFIAETIRRGRPGRRMPAFDESAGGLRGDEIAAITGFLRGRASVAEPRPTNSAARWIRADAASGRALYSRYCAGCHGVDGEGTDAPALNNPVLLATAGDDYFFETIRRGRRMTAMHGFREASVVHPTLSDSQIQEIVAHLRTLERR